MPYTCTSVLFNDKLWTTVWEIFHNLATDKVWEDIVSILTTQVPVAWILDHAQNLMMSVAMTENDCMWLKILQIINDWSQDLVQIVSGRRSHVSVISCRLQCDRRFRIYKFISSFYNNQSRMTMCIRQLFRKRLLQNLLELCILNFST